jgi:hypothetical protein
MTYKMQGYDILGFHTDGGLQSAWCHNPSDL